MNTLGFRRFFCTVSLCLIEPTHPSFCSLNSRYEEAKEQSIVAYFFELFRLSTDYEDKVCKNLLVLQLCVYNLGQNY